MIRQRGKGVWQIRLETGIDPTGKRVQTYHTFQGNKREAQAEEARLKWEIRQGTYVLPTNLTVGEYLRESLRSTPSLRPRTYEGYESMTRVHIEPALGSLLLSELRPIHLHQYYSEKRASGLSDSSVLHHHRYLHSALDKAVKLQLIVSNPATRVTPPRASRVEPQALSEKQLKAVLEATTSTELEIPALLATVTGMRRGEVLGLAWENVNLEEGLLVVGQTLQKLKGGLTLQPPKTARSARIVSLPSFAVRRLKAEKSRVQLALGLDSLDGVLVCRRTNGSCWEPGRLSLAFTDTMRKAGLEGVHFHTLRHAQASLLIRRGLDIQATGTRLGHSTATTTLNLYAHTIQETDRTAAHILDRALGVSQKAKTRIEADFSGARMVPNRILKVVGKQAE